MAKQRRAWEAINQQDSAAVAMRSVAAGLQGQCIEVWDVNNLQRRALNLMMLGGQKAAIATLERSLAATATDPALARRITTSALAAWAISLYNDADGPFDAVMIGAPNGGVTHLALALQAPFLSQNFLISYRDTSPVDDVATYQAHGAEFAEATLLRNRDLAVVNHYDPLHDRFMIKHMNHIRCKLLDLPEAYKAFIFQRLRPGGTIVFTDCRYSWPMYFINERHWFQVGGLGAVAPRDFIEGEHPDIAALQAAAGIEPTGNWGLAGRIAFDMSESEWGALAPLHDRVAQFARENAYEFVALEGANPEYFSYLAFRVWRKLLTRANVEPRGVLIETGVQVAPAATRAAALLPVWIPGNCQSSLDYLQRVQRDFRHYPALRDKPVFWLPLPAFAEAFDRASWEDWLNALEGLDVRPLGMRQHLYPADPAALYEPRETLLKWMQEHPAPIDMAAPLDLVLEESRVLRRQSTLTA